MTPLMTQLLNDERGFIVSGELVLISTIAVLALVVGLSEVANGINNELEDIGSAFGSMNQSYSVSGACGHGGSKQGSCYRDQSDFCDGKDINLTGASHEGGGYGCW